MYADYFSSHLGMSLTPTYRFVSILPSFRLQSQLFCALYGKKMMMHSIETKLLKNGNLTTLIRRDFMVLLMIFQSTSKMVRNKEDQSLIKMSGGLIIMEHRKA